MSSFTSIRTLPDLQPYKKGDTLVVFGEVFERGYVNGLIDEAKSIGMNVIYSTVGRRDEAQQLRALTPEEITAKNQSPLVNIPLEAGFDLEPAENGVSPIDQLKDYGLTGWETAQLDWTSIAQSRNRGRERFRNSVKAYLLELKKHLDPSKKLLIAHTMAGGFPRAKVVMPIANRVFKGIGPRYCSSQMFWESQIGQLCEQSFQDVTAETFHHLIELSAGLRESFKASGGHVCYLGYGYHGNEVLVGDKYEWYSYSPYLQGFAKVRLEDIAQEARSQGLQAAVFNVPEILTNSSSIFLGVEVVLYPLIRALRKEAPNSDRTKAILESCATKLKPEFSVEDIDRITQAYLTNPKVRDWPRFEGWPQHNGPEQMELMRNASTALIEMHSNQKELMTAELSETVFRACGRIMLRESFAPRAGALWIGHDAVARVTGL
jgi:hypothetical protein